MAQAYAAEHMDQTAVFELTFRKMPANRNYIVAAGIGDVLDFLANFHFGDEELNYLRQTWRVHRRVSLAAEGSSIHWGCLCAYPKERWSFQTSQSFR